MDLRSIQREAERLVGELRSLSKQMEQAWGELLGRDHSQTLSGCIYSSADRVTLAADILLAVSAGIGVHANIDEAITDADLAVAGDPRA
jgi:hypothetical protein